MKISTAILVSVRVVLYGVLLRLGINKNEIWQLFSGKEKSPGTEKKEKVIQMKLLNGYLPVRNLRLSLGKKRN